MNNLINVIIIDDEKDARDTLEIRLNENFSEINILATADNAKLGKEEILKHKPDLVFLDIEMPGGDGFSLINSFDLDEIDFEIVFTTAYENYTLKAIKVNALDYLLKPVGQEELEEALSKYKKKHANKQLAKDIKIFQQGNSQNIKLLIPTSFGFEFVTITDIIYCEAERNYTRLHIVNSREKLISKTLKEFDERLSEFDFYRIHQSYLININHIESYIKSKGGQVKMSNEVILSVSASKKDDFLKIFRKL